MIVIRLNAAMSVPMWPFAHERTVIESNNRTPRPAAMSEQAATKPAVNALAIEAVRARVAGLSRAGSPTRCFAASDRPA
jgi:hypothetical protein